MTPEVERVVAKVISEGNGHRLYWLIKPLQLADFTDLIQHRSDIERRLWATIVGQNFDPEILEKLHEAVREDIISYPI